MVGVTEQLAALSQHRWRFLVGRMMWSYRKKLRGLPPRRGWDLLRDKVNVRRKALATEAKAAAASKRREWAADYMRKYRAKQRRAT